MYQRIESATFDFVRDVNSRIDDLIAITEESDDELNNQHINPKTVCSELIDGVGLAIEKLIDAQERLNGISDKIEKEVMQMNKVEKKEELKHSMYALAGEESINEKCGDDDYD